MSGKAHGDTARLYEWRESAEACALAGQIADRWVGELALAVPRFGCKHQDGGDVGQETLARFFAQPREWRADGTLRAWLHGTARHVSIDLIRNRRVARMRYTDWGLLSDADLGGGSTREVAEPREPSHGPATRARARETIEAVRREVPRLPPAQARAIWRRVQGDRAVDTASELEITAGSVRKLICEGSKQLRDRLRAHEP